MSPLTDTVGRLFSADGFVPRRICGAWPDWLVWEHIAGNALVGLAYFAMPVLIWRLGHRRSDWSPFAGVIRAFAGFIGLCGLGHVLDMLAFFHPMYRLSGHVLIATGLVSWWTAWSIRRAWPTIIAMKGPAELERVIAMRTEELARANADLRDSEAKLRAAKDAADAANRTKDRFLAVLSHELRTPLTPVLASVTALVDEPGELDDIRPTLELIRRSVELEARLIDDLLDVNRIANGKFHLNREVVDAHDLLHLTLGICRSDLQSKQMVLHLGLEAVRHHVEADTARLQQVFWNLIKNAVKFTDAGGTLILRTRNTEGPGPSGMLVIEVSDTGFGIAAEALPRIFEAFEQGEDTITRRFGGLGLGLALSRSVVEAHGGRLWADSPGRGKGATFTLELAAVEAPNPSMPALPDSGLPAFPAGDALRILLVEDDRATLGVIDRLLRRRGHEVTTAESVATALEAGGRSEFDLVVSDIGLPDGTGWDLMRQLRERRAVPGIALTGFGMDDDVSRTREAGFVTHLTKPVNFGRLETAIRQIAAGAT